MTAAGELSARQPALKGTGEPDAVFRGTEATMRRMLSKNWVGRLAHVIAPIAVALVATAGLARDEVRAAEGAKPAVHVAVLVIISDAEDPVLNPAILISVTILFIATLMF